MRIAWPTRNIWPDMVGGVEFAVEILSKYMHAWGHPVQVWTGAWGQGVAKKLTDGRRVVGIGHRPAPGPLWRMGPLWRVWKTFQSLPRDSDVDVIFTPDPILGMAHLLRGTRVPLVYCPGGTVTGSFRWHFPAHDAEKQSRRIQESFLPPRQYLLAERFCLLRSSGIVAVSDLVKKQMLRVHGGCAGRIRTIHNGHEPSRNGRGLHPYQSRNIQAGPKRFTAICVARLHRIKNIDHLIKAWAMVRYPAKRLLLVGSGEEMPALERLVTKLHLNDTVVFLGERLDVPYHLSHADVFILPSLYEACGSAAIEAMGAGLPCITLKNVDGITEVATSGEINIDGVTGFCVDPKDPRDMAGRIDFLADHPDIRDRMGRQSYERARTHFMWEHAAQAYVTFARDIVGRSRRYRRDVSH